MLMSKRLSKRSPLRLAVVLTVGWVVSSVSGCASGPLYDLVPLVPVNVSPAEETEIANNTSVTFVWQASDTAQYYEFHLFNQQTKDISQYFRRNLPVDDVCQGGSCQLTISVSLPEATDHAWRVRAVNNAGFSGWSRTRFDIVRTGSATAGASTNTSNRVRNAPMVPDPIQPQSRSITKPGSLVDFVWSAAPQASRYDFHLFDSVNRIMVDELRDIPASTVCQGSVSCQLTRKIMLPPASNHAWRVRAVNDSGVSAWTRIEFTVQH